MLPEAASLAVAICRFLRGRAGWLAACLAGCLAGCLATCLAGWPAWLCSPGSTVYFQLTPLAFLCAWVSTMLHLASRSPEHRKWKIFLRFVSGRLDACWVFRDVAFQDVGFQNTSLKPLTHIRSTHLLFLKTPHPQTPHP